MRSSNRIEVFREPSLKFAYGQKVNDPRDGLTLFGPFDKGKVNDFNVGIIGTAAGIRRMKNWLTRVQKPIHYAKPDIAKPFFPGFSGAFHVNINFNRIETIEIDDEQLNVYYKYYDNQVRVSYIVDLYVDKLKAFVTEEGTMINLWFVVIPDKVYDLCRPKSRVSKSEGIDFSIKNKYDRRNPGLFDDAERENLREAYKYENHFHNQLKLKLLKEKILTQIIRENTIAFREFTNRKGEYLKDLTEFETAIAWNICTSIYYKIGGLPWKLGDIRKGVCYVGIVFKNDERNIDKSIACCAAQMFLDSGDGMVFKGAVGPWYTERSKEYHLDRKAARDLLTLALESFKKKNRRLPNELFIHGKTYFNDEEWAGFAEAAGSEINLVGVRIRDENEIKLFRTSEFPILRCSAFLQDKKTAYLWTRGFIPRLQSVLGLETPNPLTVQIVRGNAKLPTICKDILALTKLNYNTCIFADGVPVTLKFADMIGEILTAGPDEHIEVLPFMFYI